MERDYGRWQKLMFGAYQSQSKLFLKLKNEVFSLKASLCAKDSVIDELNVRNEMLERENRMLRVKLRRFEENNNNDNDDNRNLTDLIDDLEQLQA